MVWSLAAQVELKDKMVELRDVSLSMKELAEEVSLQTPVTVVLDVVEKEGPKVYYDCRSSLSEILMAIKGYYKFRLGLELEERWEGSKVTLKPVYRRVEVTDVKPVEEKTVLKKEKKSSKASGPNFLMRFWGKLSQGKRVKQAEPADDSEAKIKKLHLKSLKKEEVTSLEEVDSVGVIPSRMKVETVVREDLDIERFPVAEPAPSFEGSVQHPMKIFENIDNTMPDLTLDSDSMELGDDLMENEAVDEALDESVVKDVVKKEVAKLELEDIQAKSVNEKEMNLDEMNLDEMDLDPPDVDTSPKLSIPEPKSSVMEMPDL
jgi:hypothetical protein